MTKLCPKVSIGLPVHNGERYLAEALDSLLHQTFADLEIIVSDNASSDRTEAICLERGRLDNRVHYFRNDQNLGAAPNFNRTFELASGTYFKWAAHDDLLAPEYLSRCVSVLDNDPSVVLCHSEVQFIDERGAPIDNRGRLPANVSSPNPVLRFVDLASISHWCLDIFGLIRKDALKRTPLIGPYVGSDRNTLVALGLLGRFHRVPEPLFFTRHHADRSVEKIKLAYRAQWFDQKKRGRISFPNWRIFVEYIGSVNRAELGRSDRLACYRHLLTLFWQNKWRLRKDLVTGLHHFGGRRS